MRTSVPRRLWAWSWIVTLPVTLAFCAWLRATWVRFEAFRVRYDTTSIRLPLLEIGREEAMHMARRGWLTLVPDGGRGKPVHDHLRTISLFVPERSIAELDSDPPYSGFEYVDAGLWDGSRLLEAEVRYRGDYAVHWAWPKKSWRVKTDKDQLFEGMRAFNLLAPKFAEQVNNYLGYRLARRLGLLSPRTELVHLALNGRLRGLHVLVEQLDESTLRTQGRMPGDLYAGELVADDGWAGVSARVFDHAGLWEKASIDNHYPEDHREPLDRLLALLNEFPTDEVQAQLSRLVDMQAFGRMGAFEVLGQTMHFDHTHNWRLFWDKNRGHFEPAVWDPTSYAPHFRPGRNRGAVLDVDVTRLHMALFRNGDFLRARHAVIEEFFGSGEARAFLGEADLALATVREAVRVDPDRRPISMGPIDEGLAELRQAIANTLAEVEHAYLGSPVPVRYAPAPLEGGVALDLAVSGRAPVERLYVDFERPLEGPVSARVAALRGGAEVELDLAGATASHGHQVVVDVGLLSQPVSYLEGDALSLKNRRYTFEQATYQLRLAGVGGDNPVVQVRAGRSGGRAEPAEQVAAVPLEPLEELFRFAVESPALGPVLWEGEVPIEGLVELDRDLIIAPGTRVRLAPGASLVVRGRLVARGTAEQPIRFEPAGEEPWGTLALQGPRCSGSLLRYCDFTGGSGLKDGLREYSAYFSVHDAQGVRVERCRFTDSRVVDDMVHAVYSEIAFVACLFQRSLADALDLDICRGSVERCVFEDSGNDAIDLMTSEFLVIDTSMRNNGDKGISVGEGSLLLAVGDRFHHNAIGIQVKDGSTAEVWNSDFVGNSTAVDAYKKNWRYDGGGRVVLSKVRMKGNPSSVTADKASSVRVFDSFCDVWTDDAQVQMDPTVDGIQVREARDFGPPELLPETAVLRSLATDGRARIATSVRGVLGEVPVAP